MREKYRKIFLDMFEKSLGLKIFFKIVENDLKSKRNCEKWPILAHVVGNFLVTAKQLRLRGKRIGSGRGGGRSGQDSE